MKNKKGIAFVIPAVVFIIFAIVIGIVLLTTSISVLFSNLKYIAIGTTILILSVVYGLKGESSDSKNKLVFTFIIVGLAFIVLPMFGFLQNMFTQSTFVNPDWARLECMPDDSYSGQLIKYLDKQNSFTCNSFTEECRLKYEYINPPWSACKTIKIFKNNQEITLSPSNYITFKLGETIKFEEQLCITLTKSFPYTKVTMEWKPWGLYRFVGGSKQLVNSANCNIISSQFSNILESDYPGSVLYRQGGEGTKWINYVNAWNYGPATNVFTHQTYGKVYCNAGTIYSIKTLKLQNGALVELNPLYSGQKADGTTISGMGNRLTNVQCCPNEPNCGDDFTFKPTTPSCFTDAQCINAGQPIPITKTTYKYYTCESGKCVLKGPKTVECTSNAACQTGYICDLSRTNYGTCINQVGTTYCGDRTCDLNENEINCPADCRIDGKQCKWYENKVADRTTIKMWYNYIGLGKPTVIDSGTKCITASWVYLLIAVGIIMFFGVLIIIIWRPRGKTKK